MIILTKADGWKNSRWQEEDIEILVARDIELVQAGGGKEVADVGKWWRGAFGRDSQG